MREIRTSGSVRVKASNGRSTRLEAPEDDLLVFLKLMAVGLENLQPTQFRRAGPWELQFNPALPAMESEAKAGSPQ